MAYESQDKMVSHPDHYQAKNGMEVINVIEAFTEGLNGIEATDTGNIIKYACRWKHKNGIQDLEKIIWYAQHLVDYLKKEEFKARLRVVSSFQINVDASEIQTNLVKVVHIDYEDKPQIQHGTYYFLSYDDLKNGDIVECDTKYGCVLGEVVKTEDEIDIGEAIAEVGNRKLKFCRKRIGA